MPPSSPPTSDARPSVLKKVTAFLGALLLLLQLAGAAELPPAETAAVLQNLQQRRAKSPSLTADFSEEKTTHLLNKPLMSNGTLAFQVPNKFRREVKGANPSVTVSNGDKLWIYYPNFNEAELYQLGERAFFDDAIAALTAGLNFDRVAEFYRLRAFRENDGYRFVLTPRSGGVKRVVREVVVIVDDDFKIQRTEATLPKGDRVVTTYRNQRAVAVPASTFEFAPPSSAHVTQPLGK